LDWPEVTFSDNGEYVLANRGEKAWRVPDYELDESYIPHKPAGPVVDMSKMREIGHLDDIQGVEMQSNGTLLVWGYINNKVLWWWYPDQNIYHELLIDEGNGEPALSPFNDQFAICTAEGLTIIDLSSEESEIVAGCRSYFSHLVFSDDARTVFSNAGTVIDQIDLETGESLRQLRGHTYNIGKIKMSDDGDLLFSISEGPTGSGFEAAVWGLDPYTLLKKWTIPASLGLRDAMFSRDGEEVIAIMDEITVWRISDGWYMANLPGSSMALSPDGKLAAVGKVMTGFAFYDTADWSLVGTEDEISPETIPDGMPIEYYQYMLYNDTKLAKFMDKGKVMVSVNSNDVIELWRIP
jgi:WD40 repeat protein